MNDSHPVLFIHTAPWCNSCKNIVKPEHWNILTDTVKSINPDTEIRLIQHQNYHQLNKDPSKIYPRVIKAVHTFPSFVVQPSPHATKEGTMERSIIYRGTFDERAGAIVEDKKSKEETIKEWLGRALLSATGTPREEQRKINPDLMKKLLLSGDKKQNGAIKTNQKNGSASAPTSSYKSIPSPSYSNDNFARVRYRKPF